MSYANMDGVPTQTAGTSEILASDWNTYVRDNFDSIKFGHIVVANEAARPAGVAAGTMVFTTDTNTMWVYNGSAYVRAVNTASLQDSSVTSAKIADDAVTADKLRDSASTDSDRAVTSNHIRNAAITAAKLDSATGARVAQGHVTVADNAAKTALGNVAEGYMVYQLDNNKVYINSNGVTANWVEVHDLDNTAALPDAFVSQGLYYVSSGTFSSVTDFAVNSVFSSSYDHYKLILEITNNSTTSRTFLLRMRTGSSDNSSTNYNFGEYEGRYTSSTIPSGTITTQNFGFLANTSMRVGGAGNVKLFSNIDLYNPNKAERTYINAHTVNFSTTEGVTKFMSGTHNVATAYDGFSITVSTGPGVRSASGKWTVYGYKI